MSVFSLLLFLILLFISGCPCILVFLFQGLTLHSYNGKRNKLSRISTFNIFRDNKLLRDNQKRGDFCIVIKRNVYFSINFCSICVYIFCGNKFSRIAQKTTKPGNFLPAKVSSFKVRKYNFIL